jgi:hypothetical protein
MVDRLADAVARSGSGLPLEALAAARDLSAVAGQALQEAESAMFSAPPGRPRSSGSGTRSTRALAFR